MEMTTPMSCYVFEMIINLKTKITQLGHVPVSMELWERDDDGSMYANSLLEQLEAIGERRRQGREVS
jgi:hypothetical protein